jgi:hypothetical protein
MYLLFSTIIYTINNNKHWTFQPLFEENALQRVHLQTNVSLWGESRFFLNFHIWTTEVIPYNALHSEFANFGTPCIFKKNWRCADVTSDQSNLVEADWTLEISQINRKILVCERNRRTKRNLFVVVS